MIYGIVPAAGKAKRMQPLGFSKELLPLLFDDEDKPRTPIEHIINAMVTCDASHVDIIIRKEKSDIKKYLKLKHYDHANLHILEFESPSLAHSVVHNHVHKKGAIYLLGLPDTYWEPANAFSILIQSLSKTGSDIVLGLFNSAPAHLFDSVLVDTNCFVKKINVKTNPPLSKWFWGIIAFSSYGYKLVADAIKGKVPESLSEPQLGNIIDKLIKNQNLKVYGVKLPKNRYVDLGTPSRYKEWIISSYQASRHLL